MFFLPGDSYLAPIGVKNCTMVELCPGRVSPLLVAISLGGLQMGGGQNGIFLHNLSSAKLSFKARGSGNYASPCNNKRLRSRYCRLLLKLTTDKHEASRGLSATELPVIVLSRIGYIHRVIKSATEMLPMKGGGVVAQF